MVPTRIDRKLTAILSADVKGYSRLMGEDEVATIRTLTTYRELMTSLIQQHHGRVVDTPGDNLLAEFGSVVDAVTCAVEVQRELGERNAELPDQRKMEFRIGINLGDVVVEGERIYGDGVNIAARVEGLADGGGICISGKVHDEIKSKLVLGYESLGEHTVKNIAEPVRVYRINLEKPAAKLVDLPDKPSIAVLPFNNLSGDPEQEYFADGITEDIITALSHIRQFFVIARNSTFTYKGKAVDVQAVAKDLGVRYVLEGSVRKAVNRVRISAQLIDGSTGNHLWAERYDRELADIFDVQDEITQTVAGAIEPELVKAEQQRAKRKPSERLDAWDCYHRGMWHISRRSKEEIAEARRLFERAAELDPTFGPAFQGIAAVAFYGFLSGISEHNTEVGLRAARKAVELDDQDAMAHTQLGHVYMMAGDAEAAIAEQEIAIQLNPSLAVAYYYLSRAKAYSGQAGEAIQYAQSAIRLSPHDTNIGAFYGSLSFAYLSLKQYEKAVEWGRKAVRSPVINWGAHAFLTSALAHRGQNEEAQQALKGLKQRQPGVTATFVREHLSVLNTEYMDHLIDGLRKAGLPE